MSKKIKARTHSGAKKRFRRTANGLKAKGANCRHILSKRSTKVKRHARGQSVINKADAPGVERMLLGS